MVDHLSNQEASLEQLVETLLAECQFDSARSGGPGGQNVNKVETKVELRFNLETSRILAPEQKNLILKQVKTTKAGEIILTSQQERSKGQNTEDVTVKFKQLIVEALTPRKERKPTRKPRSADRRRLDEKKHQAIKKEGRSGRGDWE